MLLNDNQAILEIDDQEAGLIDLASFHQSIHEKWKPHAGQIAIGQALFYSNFKDIFACCGRNFGKTEVIAYCLWRYAFEHKKSENYCFGPIQKQIKEILWASGRIQGLGPEEYREAINNVEMRVTLNNGSFFKLDGSDNVDAYRGIKPRGLSVYDEYKDMRPDFIDAYDPNRAAFDSPAIYIGTPPEFHNHFVETMEKAKKYHGDSWFYLHAPSSMNPYISKRFLDNKKKELYESGEVEKWLREYEAIFVKGGRRTIFPQFLKLQFPKWEEAKPKDLNKWTLIITCDPGSSSVFGVLFALFNEYSKKIIVFDELYLTDPHEMTARAVHTKIMEKTDDIRKIVKEIRYVYDEAAKWFQSEIYGIPNNNMWLEPSRKSEVGVFGYIGIVRSVLNKSLLMVTENCTKFRWEMDKYMKDEKDKIPKKDDHLINCFQYKLQALGFNLEDESEPKPEDPFLAKRAIRMEDELPDNNNLIDFDSHLGSSSLEEIDL